MVKNGKIESLNCVRTEIVDGKAVDKEPEEKFTVDANTVVFAIGLKPNKSLIEAEGIEFAFPSTSVYMASTNVEQK